MRSPESFPVHIGETRYLTNGFRVETKPHPSKVKKRVTPGETAHHEAEHIVILKKRGASIKMATIVPGSDYLGLTVSSRPDPVAAAGPYANGRSGTGFDVAMVGLMGADINVVASAARSILRSSPEESEEIASVLEEKKTIGDHEVNEAMASVKKNSSPEGGEVIVYIKSPSGEENQFRKQSGKDGIVMIPGKEVTVFNDLRNSTPPEAA